MPQVGLHGLVGMLTRKAVGRKELLLLGILLGSFIPDMDNVGVAVATLAKLPTAGIHRTLTHGVFFMAVVVLAVYLFGRVKKEPSWSNLALGLGLGMLLHSLLDLLIWFNGVALFWPFSLWINLWANVTPPAWFMKFMDPAEFLFFGLYLYVLGTWARKAKTDSGFLKMLRIWMIVEFALFIILTPLAYLMTAGFQTLMGLFYLFSIFMGFFVTLRMRQTMAAAV